LRPLRDSCEHSATPPHLAMADLPRLFRVCLGWHPRDVQRVHRGCFGQRHIRECDLHCMGAAAGICAFETHVSIPDYPPVDQAPDETMTRRAGPLTIR
jgi:hypothetical protein